MSRLTALDQLRAATPVVLPSLLSCDFSNLEREIRHLEEAGVRGLHLDVMDGCFVPNITFGFPILQALRRLTDLPLDVHLMIVDPERYAEQFIDAGADILSFHVEAVEDPRPLLEKIRKFEVGAGLALNPATPLSTLDGSLDLCDLILVMSVPAGFGGQSFDEVALKKLAELRNRTTEGILLEVDGGVNEATIGRCVRAGANCLVAGTAVFQHDDYAHAVGRLSHLAESL
jgi:ribulose-phosphate 3-epimerase